MSGDDGMPPLDLSMWLDACTEFGADPEPLGELLVRDVVQAAIEEHPRSLQTEIGPSELGHPCLRWLAHKFAGTPPTGIQKPPWRPAVGTAVHAHFTDFCHAYNDRHGVVRFLADLRVHVGDLYSGRPIFGTLDALDLATATIVDLKVVGPTALRTYGPGRPESPLYRGQVHCYGQGAVNAGFPVAHVGVLRLPAAGELADAVWKAERHDPAVARDALARAGAVARTVEAMGVEAIPLMPTAEHYCGHCPYFLPNAQDLTKACPGADSVIERRNTPPAALSTLIA